LYYRTFLKRLTDKISALMLRRVGFWRDGPYSITRIDGFVPDGLSSASKWFLVVGREHYFESVKDYPVGNRNDLNNILKNERWNFPFEGRAFTRIVRLDDQSHRVTFWVIKKSVLDGLVGWPIFVIPETACIEEILDAKIAVVERLGQVVYVALTPDGLVSSLGQQSLFEQRIATSVSTSNPSSERSLKLTDGDTAEAILAGLWSIFKASPMRFFRGFDLKAIRSYPWLIAAKFSIALVIAYLTITSAYLISASWWIDHQLQSQKVLAESSLVIRKEIENKRGLMGEAFQVFSEVQPLWISWDILMDLQDRGVDVRAVNSISGAVTFYLTAPRAIDELEWLSQDARVASAEFVVPTQEFAGAEQFAIKVNFNADAVLKASSLNGELADIGSVMLKSDVVD
jgi:hypothetical protein